MTDSISPTDGFDISYITIIEIHLLRDPDKSQD